MKQVALLVADGFEEVEVVTVVDFLRRAGIKVYLTSIAGTTVTGSHHIILTADKMFAQLPDDLDALILPGGMPGAANLAQSEDVLNLIRKTNKNNKLVAAICAAPALVLGASGVLNGRDFTCYPGFEKQLTGAAWKTDRVVNDANIITSRGPGTSAEFAIAIIEYLIGKEAANTVKQVTLQNW